MLRRRANDASTRPPNLRTQATLPRAVRGLAAAVCLLALAACQNPGPGSAPGGSEVIFRFATVGDSRQQPGQAGNSAQDERWLQATPVWAHMLSEIERQRPQALIFNGDMVYGYHRDLAVLDREYAFWRGMVAGLMQRGTYVLPVPGNHELQWAVAPAEAASPPGRPKGEALNAKPDLAPVGPRRAVEAKEQAWRANMGDLIVDADVWQRLTRQPLTAWQRDHAPTAASDGLPTDQRQLSYSFDSAGLHFAVINTDPVGLDASAPVAWLRADLAAARARGVKRSFVFGHKPAFSYRPTPQATPAAKPAADAIEARPALRDAFWDVIEAFGAVYFCGHQHVYDASQPRLAQGGKAWQIIVGTAGTPLSFAGDRSPHAKDRMYAWADVAVQRSGRVQVQVWGFEAPGQPARLLERLDIAPTD